MVMDGTMRISLRLFPQRMRRAATGGHLLLLSVCAVVLLASWCGCRSTPVTGRRQLLLVPEAQEKQMGISAYEEVLKDEKPTSNAEYQQMVERVGKRIATVAGRPDYDWEFRVIDSSEKNAFALPGGKVAIYEGILPICQNEAGLAVVMAHEVAHALARHGGERMTHQKLQNGVQQAVNVMVRDRDEKQRDLVLAAYGAASQYGVILPYSRKHESEADHIGVKLMAQAGYDPSEAPRFWERFAQIKGEGGPMEFMSTHPSDARRAADLRALLPEVMELYNNAPAKFGLGSPL